MIQVTRLNGAEIYLNPDLIACLEATPDTVVKLTTGEKYVLKEDIQTVIHRFLEYKRSIGVNPERLTPV